MLVEEITATLAELELADRHLERVRLPATDRTRAVQRVVTDHGTVLGLRLPRGTVLSDGDVLHADDTRVIVISSEASPVIVIRPRTMLDMGQVAHTLGNRHLPAQFETRGPEGLAEMIVPDDHTVVQHLAAHGIPHERTERVLTVPFRHAEHSH
ncbi:Urease accessory protein UreE [Enemella evansiae]|uniref:urease accessory protein UreE n=1 Tax=Enemella evansiae TaxID=2016499 RepID=UPI000B96E1E4|nr:urease accessory protein UreE [Enemella evansiae]OYO20111.1 Urease accessory protein UreE [Enemella evansiae]